MDVFSFPRYLSAKRSVDDRALNPRVWGELATRLRARPAGVPLRVLEIGAGTGTMIQRMAEAGLLDQARYLALDAEPQNIQAARSILARWGAEGGCRVQETPGGLCLEFGDQRLEIVLETMDVYDFLRHNAGQAGWDVVIANAFLDLVDIPGVLPLLRALVEPGGLFYFSINFDGLTIFEPGIDPAWDAQILRLYHHSMDTRLSGGDSRSGRRMFHYLHTAGYTLLEAGGSDWVVYARDGQYPADECYFLHCILHFFEDSLRGLPDLPPEVLDGWLRARREQIERGELVYIAHQLDFLAQRGMD